MEKSIRDTKQWSLSLSHQVFETLLIGNTVLVTSLLINTCPWCQFDALFEDQWAGTVNHHCNTKGPAPHPAWARPLRITMMTNFGASPYSHVLPSLQEEAFTRLNALLTESQNPVAVTVAVNADLDKKVKKMNPG